MLIIRLAIISGLLSLIVLFTSTHVYAGANDIWVMTYNVENLFDAEKDPGKRDWFFLPKNYPGKAEACMSEPAKYRKRCLDMDWTDEKVNLKLMQIRTMFQAIGGLPDVLALQEVENVKVVKRLAAVLGYQFYLFHDAQDRRGIDVAILYNTHKIRLIDWVSRSPNSPSFDRPTRDILAGFFQVNGSPEVLAVYANHWPSQAAPAPKRVAVAQKLVQFMEADRHRFQGAYNAVVLGDFNTVADDWPHPHKDVILSPNWPNSLIDVYLTAKSRRKLHKAFPLGSYFYFVKMLWQNLDKIFATKNMFDGRGLEVDLRSYRIHRMQVGTHTFIYNRDSHAQIGSQVTGVPWRYNHSAVNPAEAGFSDHFPVSVVIKVR